MLLLGRFIALFEFTVFSKLSFCLLSHVIFVAQIIIDNLPIEANEVSVRKLSEEKGGPVSNPLARLELLKWNRISIVHSLFLNLIGTVGKYRKLLVACCEAANAHLRSLAFCVLAPSGRSDEGYDEQGEEA